MKASVESAGIAPGASRPSLITGRVSPGTPTVKRKRLGVARVVLLHFLEEDCGLGANGREVADARVISMFDNISIRLGLARASATLRRARLRRDHRTERRIVRKLERIIVRKNRALYSAMKPVGGALGLGRWPWLQRELAILFMQRLGLCVVDPSERPPDDEPFARRVTIVVRPNGIGMTQREARATAISRVNELFPVSDGASMPRRRAGRGLDDHTLAEYVYWFYLRRCLGISERRVALKFGIHLPNGRSRPVTRSRVGMGVKMIERLFDLVTA